MEEQQTVKKKGINPLLIAGVVILLLGGGWLVLSQNKAPIQQNPSPTAAMENMNEENEESSPTGAMMEESTETTPGTEEIDEEITIEGKNFSFSQSTINVDKGDRVKVTFKNTAGFHDWRLDYNGKEIGTKTIQAGETDSVTFVADTAGTFTYFCSVGNHRQQGMEGKLIVQ